MKQMNLWQIITIVLVVSVFKFSLAQGVDYNHSLFMAGIVTIIVLGAVFSQIAEVLPHPTADPFWVAEARPKLCALASVSFSSAIVFVWNIIPYKAFALLFALCFGILAVTTAWGVVKTSTKDKASIQSKLLVSGISLLAQVVILSYFLRPQQ